MFLGVTLEEVWKDVKGWEGIYKVSSKGRVKSIERAKGEYGSGRAVHEHIMAHALNHKGYKTVHLSREGFNKRVAVHRLVAIAFIPNPDNLPQVNHIDGNKLNNSVDNLEWVTNLDNMRHAVKNGLTNMGPCLNAAHTPEVHKKVSEKRKKRVLRSDGAIFPSVNDAAKAIGVSHSAISMNIHGKTNRCGGYTFSFV